MELLKALQTVRTPLLDEVIGLITRFGEETIFMVAGMLVLWCLNKKWGFRFMAIGLAGTALNQLLKAIFLIPRPWVLDPEFEIVEAAREAADGYSFPSGHTQSAATLFGTLAAWLRRGWLTVACIVMVLLVGFSRMYLGVHTPLDVGVSLITGLLTVVGYTWLFNRCEGNDKAEGWIYLGSFLFSLVLVAYVYLAPVREANIPEFDAHGVKNAWTVAGTMAGMLIAWVLDRRYVRFDTKACWWAQVCKVIIGLALVVGVKEGAKPLLKLIFGDAQFAHAIRYCLMAVTGGALWPMTFRWWQKAGKKPAQTMNQ